VGYPAGVIFNVLYFIISIIGLILIFFAIKYISNYYNNYKPFKYMLYSLISGIAFIALILLFLHAPVLSSTAIANSISRYTSFITTLLIMIILVPIFISIIFQYIAYNSAGKLTGYYEFHPAALVLLIGAIINIIGIVNFVFYISGIKNIIFLDAIDIVILLGTVLTLSGVMRLIIAFIKLPGKAKSAENNRNFNQDIHKEMF